MAAQHNINILIGTCSWANKTLIEWGRIYPSDE